MIYLVGNFADMDEREVSEDEALEFARSAGLHHYIEPSAKTG